MAEEDAQGEALERDPAPPPPPRARPVGVPRSPRPPLKEVAKNLHSSRPGTRYAAPRRVLSVGRLLGKGSTVWLRNFVPFTVISLVCYSPLILVEVATTPRGVGPVEPSLLPLLLKLAGWALGFLATGAMAYGTVESLRGSPASLSACLGRGFSRLPTILGTALWVAVYIIVLSMVLGLLGAFVVGALTFLAGNAIGVFIAVLLQVLPVALVLALFWVAIPAAVIERLPARRALERSKNLTRGNFAVAFWSVVILLVVQTIVEVGTLFAAQRGMAVVDPDTLAERVAPTFDRVLLAMLPLAVQVLVLGPITAVASAVSYHDLRVAVEGTTADELVRVFE